MPVKKWFRELQPAQLYIILGLTVTYFIITLGVSHWTHSLTLLMDSYQTLCNIIALSGCLITIKHGKGADNTVRTAECDGKELTRADISKLASSAQESKLKNTFGWARIDVITMVICCIFQASLIFSIFMEALQTLGHIDHTDEMHEPIIVGSIGCGGLILNGICYVMIGGYTFHQGSFLYVTESGDVVLENVVSGDSIRKGERRLSRTRVVPTPQTVQRQSCKEIMRDVLACAIVIVDSIIIYSTEKVDIAKYVDPAFAMLSSSILLFLSYPYMKESCLILLQTIPASMDIDALKKQLLEHFPTILNVHDLHVWQLTTSKVISTVHIILQNPKVFQEIQAELKAFFADYGITQVTIQPEFYSKLANGDNTTNDKKKLDLCLMKCLDEGCKTNICCPEMEEDADKALFKKSTSKEVVGGEEPSPVTLKSVKVDKSELPEKTVKKLEKVSDKIDKMIDGGNKNDTGKVEDEKIDDGTTTIATENNDAVKKAEENSLIKRKN